MHADFETIWNQLSGRLRAFILSRVEDDAAAEDILQDVFLRIHTHLESVQDAAKLESWIFQIARNAVIDHYRLGRRFVDLSETLGADDELLQEEDTATELAGSLREIAESLPDPYREALVLVDFQGLSQQELAKRQGISLSGAKSRVQRARQKIREALLYCCHFEFDRYGRVIEYWEHCCCCSGTRTSC